MIYLIDQIKQKNDGNFFLVDAADISWDGESMKEALAVATDDEATEMLDEVFGASESE